MGQADQHTVSALVWQFRRRTGLKQEAMAGHA